MLDVERVQTVTEALLERYRQSADAAHSTFRWKAHALEQADDIIELLNDDATRELEQQMEDPSNYSPAKAMIMQAMAQGVDLWSKEAIGASMLSQMQSGATPGSAAMYDDQFASYGEPAPSPLTPEQQRASQKKRRKNRKAHKKNR